MHSFLEAHRLQPRERAPGAPSVSEGLHDCLLASDAGQEIIYDLSLSRPLAIRDQLVRATTVVDLLVAYERLGDRAELLIVGAGVTGIAAAMRAVERYGIRTVIIEREAYACSRQAGSRRLIDPSVYNWPSPSWKHGRFEALAPRFAWKTSFAWDFLEDWSTEFEEFVREQSEKLVYLKQCVVLSPGETLPEKTSARSWAARVHPRRTEGTIRSCGISVYDLATQDERGELDSRQFAAVLLCGGPGEERVWPGPDRDRTKEGFRSHQFWSASEPLYRPPSDRARPERVVISGNGDGALQDFIYMVTGKHVRDLVDLLELPDELLYEVSAIEDDFQRRFTWLSGSHDAVKVHECALLEAWHQKYVDLIDDHRWKFLGKLQAVLQEHEGPRMLHMVYSCDHFGWCYPLNRFLALSIFATMRREVRLLDSAASPISETGTYISVWENHTIKDVSGQDGNHECKPRRPSDCDGKKHQVTLARRACLSGAAVGDEFVEAERIIIRHGILARPLRVFGDQVSTMITRMMLPYSILNSPRARVAGVIDRDERHPSVW